MRVEIVPDEHDLVGVGLVKIDEILDAVRPVNHSEPPGHRHVPPGTPLLPETEVGGAMPLVLGVLPAWLAG